MKSAAWGPSWRALCPSARREGRGINQLSLQLSPTTSSSSLSRECSSPSPNCKEILIKTHLFQICEQNPGSTDPIHHLVQVDPGPGGCICRAPPTGTEQQEWEWQLSPVRCFESYRWSLRWVVGVGGVRRRGYCYCSPYAHLFIFPHESPGPASFPPLSWYLLCMQMLP